MASLFILGLPRSLTTLACHVSVQSLNLSLPPWCVDGEILNGDYVPVSGRLGSADERFTTERADPGRFYRLQQFALDASSNRNYVVKDVVQPFVMSTLLHRTQSKALVIRRPLAEVAMLMWRRGWHYPTAAAQVHAGRAGLVEGLLRAAQALSGVGGTFVDYDSLIKDSESLVTALQSLFPFRQIVTRSYIDAAFRIRCHEILEQRHSGEYREWAALLDKTSRSIEILPPEGWDHIPARRSSPALRRSTAPRPKVLLVGDAVAPTGFARVTSSIVVRLLEKFDIHQLGINYHGDPHGHAWPIYPALAGGDAHGINRVQDLTGRLKPDLIFLVNDLWVISRYLQALDAVAFRCPVIAYAPVEAGPVAMPIVESLQGLDRLIAYNSFGRQAVETSALQLNQRDRTFRLPPIDVIPHGVDTGTFYPIQPGVDVLNARREARRKLMPHDPDVHDGFVVLNANRNQPRKRIDLTMAGFAQFAAGKPAGVKLFLHMGGVDVGWNIAELARRYGISDRLIMSQNTSAPPTLTLRQLNEVYNACEVGINTAEAEGWGLAAFEHAATGGAQIVPAHNGLLEMWEGNAELLDISARVTDPTLLTECGLVSPESVAAALERLYEDEDLLNTRAKQAYTTATAPRYSWNAIAQLFSAAMMRAIEDFA